MDSESKIIKKEDKKRKVLRYSGDNKLTEYIEDFKEKKIDESELRRNAQVISLASEIGYSICLPIAGGAILGRFLDLKLGTSPRITLFLIFLGLSLGVYNVYTILKKIKD